MKNIFGNAVAIALSVIGSASLLATGVAAQELSYSEASAAYKFEAMRADYSCDLASFSVDLPAGYPLAPEDAEEIVLSDGSLEWSLFFGEDVETGYISCAFHQSELGYDGEIEAIKLIEDTPVYSGTDKDGKPYSVAEFRLEGFNAFIGVFPWENDTWINITVCMPPEDMDAYRDDVVAMFSTFDRPDSDKQSPDTGVEAPAVLAGVAVLSTAAVAVAKRGKNEK